MEKKVINTKTYIVKSIFYDDGTTELNRTSDGFSAIELLGVLELTQLDIQEQMKGTIKPDIVKRTVIED